MVEFIKTAVVIGLGVVSIFIIGFICGLVFMLKAADKASKEDWQL